MMPDTFTHLQCDGDSPVEGSILALSSENGKIGRLPISSLWQGGGGGDQSHHIHLPLAQHPALLQQMFQQHQLPSPPQTPILRHQPQPYHQQQQHPFMMVASPITKPITAPASSTFLNSHRIDIDVDFFPSMSNSNPLTNLHQLPATSLITYEEAADVLSSDHDSVNVPAAADAKNSNNKRRRPPTQSSPTAKPVPATIITASGRKVNRAIVDQYDAEDGGSDEDYESGSKETEDDEEPSRKGKQSKSASDNSLVSSPMECGHVRNGERVFNEFSAFFGKDVELYTAENDPKRRPLVRASQLADMFKCATNKVGMYLARRRQTLDGLYQASTFMLKPPGRTGLKSGGYFLSLEVCQQFREHYAKSNTTPPKETTTTPTVVSTESSVRPSRRRSAASNRTKSVSSSASSEPAVSSASSVISSPSLPPKPTQVPGRSPPATIAAEEPKEIAHKPSSRVSTKKMVRKSPNSDDDLDDLDAAEDDEDGDGEDEEYTGDNSTVIEPLAKKRKMISEKDSITPIVPLTAEAKLELRRKRRREYSARRRAQKTADRIANGVKSVDENMSVNEHEAAVQPVLGIQIKPTQQQQLLLHQNQLVGGGTGSNAHPLSRTSSSYPPGLSTVDSETHRQSSSTPNLSVYSRHLPSVGSSSHATPIQRTPNFETRSIGSQGGDFGGFGRQQQLMPSPELRYERIHISGGQPQMKTMNDGKGNILDFGESIHVGNTNVDSINLTREAIATLQFKVQRALQSLSNQAIANGIPLPPEINYPPQYQQPPYQPRPNIPQQRSPIENFLQPSFIAQSGLFMQPQLPQQPQVFPPRLDATQVSGSNDMLTSSSSGSLASAFFQSAPVPVSQSPPILSTNHNLSDQFSSHSTSFIQSLMNSIPAVNQPTTASTPEMPVRSFKEPIEGIELPPSIPIDTNSTQ